MGVFRDAFEADDDRQQPPERPEPGATMLMLAAIAKARLASPEGNENAASVSRMPRLKGWELEWWHAVIWTDSADA